MNERENYLKYLKKNDRRCFFQYEYGRIYSLFKHKNYHFNPKKVAGRKVMTREESNSYIAEMIESGKPFWLARYGHTETAFLNSVLYDRFSEKPPVGQNYPLTKTIHMLYNNAGFFPEDIEEGKKYADMVIEAASEVDIHATWELYMEDYIVSQYEKDSVVTRWGHIAPYYNRRENGDLPWTHALKGKKVLVINPFAESILKQYKENREHLFEKIYDADNILPEFELKVLKAVQTVAEEKDSRFATWFEALDWMIDECKKIDFDIALVGCGAYGYLLASAIKKMGKSAIQTCGSTQMMFGILGSRWENDKRLMNEVVNEYWIHPSDNEVPASAKNVEGGCYW